MFDEGQVWNCTHQYNIQNIFQLSLFASLLTIPAKLVYIGPQPNYPKEADNDKVLLNLLACTIPTWQPLKYWGNQSGDVEMFNGKPSLTGNFSDF